MISKKIHALYVSAIRMCSIKSDRLPKALCHRMSTRNTKKKTMRRQVKDP